MSKIKPYWYQSELSDKGVSVLKELNIVYFSIQTRCGKTITSFLTAEKYGAKKVLFVTRKKAIPSIESDYALMNPSFEMQVINHESIHHIKNKDFDLIISDENHSCSAYPRPSKRTKALKEYVGSKPVIMMSATPTPESWSQIYHQFWISDNSPWRHYRNFYAWARDYVNIYEKWIAGSPKRFYDKANKEKIMEDIKPYFISFTQADAGFNQVINEEIKWLDMPDNLKELYSEMDGEGVILRDTWAVAASNAADIIGKLSQISGGTIKVSDDTSIELSRHKAEFIRDEFSMSKIAIFYKYKAERILLEDVFPNHTGVAEEFQNSNVPIFLGQIRSIREGVKLSEAECIIFYNIDFSATSYHQAINRLQSKDREEPAKVYWIFYNEGIESYVYKAVQKKKNFTSSYYRSVRKLEMV